MTIDGNARQEDVGTQRQVKEGINVLCGLPWLFLAVFSACAGQQAQPGPGAAIVFEKRTFKLVKTSDPDLEAALEGLLSAGYNTAVKNHAGDRPMKTGFTYSLAPRGAVYPFSEIEVSCIMQEKYARRSGPEICGDFFRELDVKIKHAVKSSEAPKL